jgi:hypothetical protein
MNYDSTDSRSIPPLQVDGDLICDNKEKAKIFNDFFCSQSDLDDTNIPTPNIFVICQITSFCTFVMSIFYGYFFVFLWLAKKNCLFLEKAKMFNDFFCSQSDLDDTNIPTPNIFLRQQGSLGHIVITENEVEDILTILDISKASDFQIDNYECV